MLEMQPYHINLKCFYSLGHSTITLLKEKDSVLAWAGEGYDPMKLTPENFLEFYKKRYNQIKDGNYLQSYIDGFYWYSTILIENLSLKKPKNSRLIMLKTPIVVSISKDILEPELEGLAKLTMDFWKYYELETYKENRRLVFNMKQSEWNGLIEKTSNLGETLETNNLSFIFNPIFKFFQNTLDPKSYSKFNLYVDKYTVAWKINLIKKESSFVIELFWPKVIFLKSFFGINFAWGLLSYSFFFHPNVKNIPDDGKYWFLQIIEFNVS